MSLIELYREIMYLIRYACSSEDSDESDHTLVLDPLLFPERATKTLTPVHGRAG